LRLVTGKGMRLTSLIEYFLMAERVGFVSENPAHVNDLGLFSISQITRTAQKPEYQVQNRYSACGTI
jgi:hypothetical protein